LRDEVAKGCDGLRVQEVEEEEGEEASKKKGEKFVFHREEV
jgi:hypothetical protein